MRKNNAFTLIELLVVVAIIGILSALIVVGMSSTTQKATIAKAQVFSNSLRNSLMDNLISEWKFDDASSGSSTAAVDSWSGNNSGTLTNFNFNTTDGWRTGADCIVGNCLLFDGTNDYVGAGNGSGFNNLTAFTIEFWEKTATPNRDFMQKAVAAGNQRSFGVSMPASGITEFRISPDGVSWSGFEVGSVNVADNKWNHIVTIYSGTQLMIYVNGVRDTPPASYSGGVFTAVADFNIGTSYFIGPFLGYLDNIRFYDSSVSMSEIKRNYYSGLNDLLFGNGITQREYSDRIAEFNAYYAKK
ncbi:MAG: LamG-like jellyroll fold domain-containing protein [Candidatus Paceibacterota bacterium]